MRPAPPPCRTCITCGGWIMRHRSGGRPTCLIPIGTVIDTRKPRVWWTRDGTAHYWNIIFVMTDRWITILRRGFRNVIISIAILASRKRSDRAGSETDSHIFWPMGSGRGGHHIRTSILPGMPSSQPFARTSRLNGRRAHLSIGSRLGGRRSFLDARHHGLRSAPARRRSFTGIAPKSSRRCSNATSWISRTGPARRSVWSCPLGTRLKKRWFRWRRCMVRVSTGWS